jgi:hypothetical protein
MDTSMDQNGTEDNGVFKMCSWCDEPLLPNEPHTLCQEAERKQGKLF